MPELLQTQQVSRVKAGALYVAKRLTEPSSWAGIAALAGVFGIQVAGPAWEGSVMAVSGLASAASIFLAEQK